MNLSPRRGCPNRCGRNPFARALPRGGSNRTANLASFLSRASVEKTDFFSVQHQGSVRRPKRGRDGKSAVAPVCQMANDPGLERKQHTRDDGQPSHRCEHSVLPPARLQLAVAKHRIRGCDSPLKNNGFPWFNSLAEAARWLNEQEEARLGLENIDRPNTKGGSKTSSAST